MDSQKSTNQPLNEAFAEGLRKLAGFIESNPEFAEWFEHSFITSGISVHVRDEDQAEALGRFARALLRSGAKVDKDITESFFHVIGWFGVVKTKTLTWRSEVCERRQVGTETVTRHVPDPAAELVEITEEVPVFEWDCKPLLAGGES